MAIVFQYTGTEALEMIKQYYPNDWLLKINRSKNSLIRLSRTHNISLEKAYKKFIMPIAVEGENILFFAALSELIKLQKMSNPDKSAKAIELQEKRNEAAKQIVALEKNTNINYEDQKILRGYYTKLQQALTTEIDELINSFQVIEPQLIIHQPGLFDSQLNS